MNYNNITQLLKDGFPKSEKDARDFLNAGITPSNGNEELLTAYCNDVLGNEKTAQGHYESAFKLSFDESQLETWYVSYGSTLRWNKEYDNSLIILNKGKSFYKENKDLDIMIGMTRYDMKEISQEEMLKIVNDSNPKRLDWVIKSLDISV